MPSFARPPALRRTLLRVALLLAAGGAAAGQETPQAPVGTEPEQPRAGGEPVQLEPAQAVGAETAAAGTALGTALELARSGHHGFAFEHLRRIDPSRLSAAEARAFAGLLLHTVAGGDSRLVPDAVLAPAVAACASVPHLAAVPACSEARALAAAGRGDVGQALEAWSHRLERWPEDRHRLFAFVLGVLGKLAHRLQRDPAVQSGELARFVEGWLRDPVLRRHPELDLAAVRLLLDLDPEGPLAAALADRAVRELSADPRALALRGELERLRGRLDRALPWLLWAAYTANSRLREDAPQHWGRLAQLYAQLGWTDRAGEAYDRSLLGDDRRALPSEEAPRLPAECRSWHDGLLGYHPERLIRETASSWQVWIEDLAEWEERCRLPEPVPACLDGSASGPLLPREAARRLSRSRPAAGPGQARRWSESLLCLVRRSPLLPPELIRLATAEPTGALAAEPAFWQARARVEARLGDLASSLEDWNRSLELAAEGRAQVFLALLSELLATPAERLRGRPPAPSPDLGAAEPDAVAARTDRPPQQVLRRLLRRWSGSHPEGPRAAYAVLGLARLEQHLDPMSPAAREAADRALLETRASADALRLRGRLELLRGRPDRALPWLAWARRGEGGSPASGLHLDLLHEAFTAVGWWQEAEDLLGHRHPPLEPASVLPPLLPSACRPLLDRIADQELESIVQRQGSAWQQAVPHHREWQHACTVPAAPLD